MPQMTGFGGVKVFTITGVTPGNARFRDAYARSQQWNNTFEDGNDAFNLSFDVLVYVDEFMIEEEPAEERQERPFSITHLPNLQVQINENNGSDRWNECNLVHQRH